MCCCFVASRSDGVSLPPPFLCSVCVEADLKNVKFVKGISLFLTSTEKRLATNMFAGRTIGDLCCKGEGDWLFIFCHHPLLSETSVCVCAPAKNNV